MVHAHGPPRGVADNSLVNHLQQVPTATPAPTVRLAEAFAKAALRA